MPRKYMQRLMPNQEKLKQNKHLKIFGSVIHDANLWHLNRRSASGAFAIGLFFAFIPVPFQMILAGLASILFRTNFPLAVGLVWLTNPLTMPAIFYGCYLAGVLLLGQEQRAFAFEPTWQWMMESLSTIGPAFLTGCLFLAIVFATIGYFGVNALWRYSVSKAWKNRRSPKA